MTPSTYPGTAPRDLRVFPAPTLRLAASDVGTPPSIVEHPVVALKQQLSLILRRDLIKKLTGPFSVFTPALLAVAARYALRKPGRAAVIAVVVGGLVVAGRAVRHPSSGAGPGVSAV